MTRSKLCTYSRITSQHSAGRGGNKVCKITPHYMAARWTGKQCADYFATSGREASANYCIGYGGDIAQSVDENDRAWTSSNGANDRKAITIECANNADSSLTDETWAALVSLCADICRRYGFRLTYDGTKDGSLTEHRMFSATSCPGAWLHARMPQLAAEVNARLDGATAPAVPEAPSTATATTTNGSAVDLGGDEIWGPKFSRELQRQRGTVVDGVISGQAKSNAKYFWATSGTVAYGSGGSTVIRSLQALTGAAQDGHYGPNSIRAHQAWLRKQGYSVAVDGYHGKETNRAMAQALRAGKYRK